MKLAYRLSLTVILLLSGAAQAYSQTSLAGRWVWKQSVQPNKSQVQFSIVIHHEGNLVHGVYSVDEFINGEWQGEDGNQTPFRGRVGRDTVEIEFDPMATVPGYQENVTYQPPNDGRAPSRAVLTLKNKTLLWHSVKGSIERIPIRLTLRRQRNP